MIHCITRWWSDVKPWSDLEHTHAQGDGIWSRSEVKNCVSCYHSHQLLQPQLETGLAFDLGLAMSHCLTVLTMLALELTTMTWLVMLGCGESLFLSLVTQTDSDPADDVTVSCCLLHRSSLRWLVCSFCRVDLLLCHLSHHLQNNFSSQLASHDLQKEKTDTHSQGAIACIRRWQILLLSCPCQRFNHTKQDWEREREREREREKERSVSFLFLFLYGFFSSHSFQSALNRPWTTYKEQEENKSSSSSLITHSVTSEDLHTCLLLNGHLRCKHNYTCK